MVLVFVCLVTAAAIESAQCIGGVYWCWVALEGTVAWYVVAVYDSMISKLICVGVLLEFIFMFR